MGHASARTISSVARTLVAIADRNMTDLKAGGANRANLMKARTPLLQIKNHYRSNERAVKARLRPMNQVVVLLVALENRRLPRAPPGEFGEIGEIIAISRSSR